MLSLEPYALQIIFFDVAEDKEGTYNGGEPCRPSSECTQILDECITLSAWLHKMGFGM